MALILILQLYLNLTVVLIFQRQLIHMLILSHSFKFLRALHSYASQARKIVNEAQVNEDPNAKMVRELRLEIEQLRAQYGDGAGKVRSTNCLSVFLFVRLYFGPPIVRFAFLFSRSHPILLLLPCYIP